MVLSTLSKFTQLTIKTLKTETSHLNKHTHSNRTSVLFINNFCKVTTNKQFNNTAENATICVHTYKSSATKIPANLVNYVTTEVVYTRLENCLLSAYFLSKG